VEANEIFPEHPEDALTATRGIIPRVRAGGEDLLVAGAHDLHQIDAADQGLVLPEQMSVLGSASDNLFGDVLNVGKGFAVPVRCDGGKPLIVALYQAIRAKRERVVCAELLIESDGPFPEPRVIRLDGGAVIAEFGEEAASPEDAAFIAGLVTDRQIGGGIF